MRPDVTNELIFVAVVWPILIVKSSGDKVPAVVGKLISVMLPAFKPAAVNSAAVMSICSCLLDHRL